MAILAIEDLRVNYGKIRALKGVSMKLQEGECLALIGPNGAGKSTFLDTISGLVSQQHGKIMVNGVDLTPLTPAQRVKLGVTQCPERRHLFPFMTIRDNLLMGAYNKSAREFRKENMEFVFSLFPVLQERQNDLAHTLSGGEGQMVSLGRAILSNPRLLLLDEPMLGVAPMLRDEFSNVVENLKKKKVAVLVTEQELSLAMKTAEMLYVIVNGTIIAKGTPDELRNEKNLKELYFV